MMTILALWGYIMSLAFLTVAAVFVVQVGTPSNHVSSMMLASMINLAATVYLIQGRKPK